tara:strand:+ start:777 stop:1913 length:1137 start_codon:yes stop_codon:yes gene_type:complete
LSTPAILALKDGTIFQGISIGSNGQTVGEVVFNTAMTGYQEILTDPSYAQQIIMLTYPHIGNTGTNREDMESEKIFASGLIIRDPSMTTSSWRSDCTLSEFLKNSNTVAIGGIDTRKLTRKLREEGAQSGCIVAKKNISSSKEAIKCASDFSGISGMDLAQVVTTSEIYEWTEGSIFDPKLPKKNFQKKLHVVAYDFGIKRNILRLLVDHGCHVTVVPAKTSSSDVINLMPDGVFLSNGPGDPEPCDYAISSIKEFLNVSIPIFGICLGYQLLALAAGAETVKMKFGHHGANHPVQNTQTKRVTITSQNHGFAVDEKSLSKEIVITHRSLFDATLQGIKIKDRPAYGFQGHPEASPGPHDLLPIFEPFISYMKNKNNK